MMLLLSSDTVNISQGTLVTIVIAMLGFIGVLVTLLHKNMTDKIESSDESMRKGLQAIHIDLRPLVVTVALHEEKLKEFGKDQRDIMKKIDIHDGRIQQLESKVDKLT